MADYNPVPTVLPSTSSPNNLLTNRASPSAFGAQIGQSTERLGGALSQAGASQMDIQIKKQGLLNEGYVADAETDLNTQFGQINGEYKSLKNQEAVNKWPEYLQKTQQVRQNVLSKLPNDAAKKSFNVVAARAEGFMLRELGDHKATQEKSMVTTANNALRDSFIDQTSSDTVANDDGRLGYIEGSIKDLNQKIVMDQGWDLSTKEGKDILEKENNLVADKVWTNIIKTLADGPKGDVLAAVKKLNDNKEHIPSATYANLSQQLNSRFRAASARDGAHETNSMWEGKYNEFISGLGDTQKASGITINQLAAPTSAPKAAWTGLHPAQSDYGLQLDVLRDRFQQQESGGNKKATEENPYQIQPETFERFKAPGETLKQDGQKVFDRMITKYARDYNNDIDRMAVAYYSGEGNVAPVGSANPWKEDIHKNKKGEEIQPVSEYVRTLRNKFGLSQPGAVLADQTQPVQSQSVKPIYKTKAEFYELNKDKIDESARAWAQEHFPNDPVMEDTVVQRTQQQYSAVISEENAKRAISGNLVQRFAFGEQNGNQMIRSVSELENGPPEIQQAWKDMRMLNPLGAETIERAITNHARTGTQLEYGTDFWRHYEDVVSGRTTDIGQLKNYLGPTKNSPVTNTGLSALMDVMKTAKDPNGAAFLESEKQYFERLRTEIVGGLGIHNPNGERIFTRAIQQALPKIEAARRAQIASGGSGYDASIFDEDNPNYPGGANSWDGRSIDQRYSDLITARNAETMDKMMGTPYQVPVKPLDFGALDKVASGEQGIPAIQHYVQQRTAVKKPLTTQEFNTLEQYMLRRGWIKPTMPTEVPRAQ